MLIERRGPGGGGSVGAEAEAKIFGRVGNLNVAPIGGTSSDEFLVVVNVGGVENEETTFFKVEAEVGSVGNDGEVLGKLGEDVMDVGGGESVVVGKGSEGNRGGNAGEKVPDDGVGDDDEDGGTKGAPLPNAGVDGKARVDAPLEL